MCTHDLTCGQDVGSWLLEGKPIQTTLPIVFGLACGCVANINSPTLAAATGFEFITTAVDQSNWKESDPRDLVSVQVYITFDDVLDRLVMVNGKPGFNLTLSTDDAAGFFQSANASSNTSDTRTSAVIAVFPSAEADSYVSIGLLNNDSGDDVINTTGMDWATFNGGGPLQVLDTDLGGAWFVPGDDSQGIATDGHVFIGQFTVASGSAFSGTLNYLYLDNATGVFVEMDEVALSFDPCKYDSDGDGTTDCIDGCPNDPNKVEPGICGCGVADTDTDGDGALDCNDGCPDDPNKVDPGQCGCGVPDTDSDGDGAADCIDGCPNDPNKVDPGQCGCGVPDTDSDGDGAADCIDGCPNDPNKVDPGQCGCGVPDTDSDGDGAADCIDGCPNDPNKVEPGICGCGVADTDTDGDGALDCNDGCPDDPNKVAPGVCGCGVADTDSDADGTPDCNDECPSDPNKVAPGVCGCGVADTDSDGDGALDCNDAFPNDPNESNDFDGDGVGDNSDPCPAWTGSCSDDASTWIIATSDGDWAITDALWAAENAWLAGIPPPSTIQVEPGTYQGFSLGLPIEIVGTLDGDSNPAATITSQVSISTAGSGGGSSGTAILRNLNFTDDMNSAIYIDASKSLIAGCIIASSRSGIECGGGSDVTVIGCTIQNCNAYSDGGAIRLENSTASITNCTMSNNSSPQEGGAVSSQNSSIIMTNCEISSNQASDGGGIWLFSSDMVIQSCVIQGNTADDDGGGVYASGSSNALTVYDSSIKTNFAANESGGSGTDDGGGGLCMLGGTLLLVQSSVSSNSTLGNAGGLILMNVNAQILHTTVQANASAYLAGGIYSQGSTEIASSKVCANSLSQIVGSYLDAGGNSIANNCDSQVGACCIESPDFGEICLFTDSSDCSSYGGQWHGSGTSCTIDSPCAIELMPCSADVTGDWKVDVFDIIFLLDSWGNTSGNEDINDDGNVNVVDLILLLQNWGDCEVLQ